MVVITQDHVTQLIAVEAHVHYGEQPPPGRMPFVSIRRDSPILISAPHGARTFRNTADEVWHEEDEYTAGMAFLLADMCNTSVISTAWRTDDSDPNFHGEARSVYKQEVRRIASSQSIRWVIDLHGASEQTKRMGANQLIDLGTRRDLRSLPEAQLNQFQGILETNLRKGTVHHNGFPAKEEGRSITAFCHGDLGLNAVQVEMKPSVRIPRRRTDATLYASEGPFTALPRQIIGMMQSLVDFMEDLKRL